MSLSRKARRHLFYSLIVAAAIGRVVFLFTGEGGFFDFRNNQKELRNLQLENQRLAAAQSDLLARVEALREDSNAWEKLLRENDMALPGEIIVKIPE